jgi:sec-independent protein translocase protein TatC
MKQNATSKEKSLKWIFKGWVYTSEMKWRFCSFLFSFFFTFFTVYSYSSEFLFLLSKSFKSFSFIFTDISEGFQTYLELSFTLSFYAVFPFFIYQCCCFFFPGLFKNERRKVLAYFQLFLVLYIASFFFSWFLLLPFLWDFFSHFEIQEGILRLNFEARILSNLQFSFKVLFASQLFCFLPFLALFLFRFLGLSKSFLVENRNICYFILLLFCSFVCPPEPLLQLCSSLICLFIFECFIFFLYLLKEYEPFNK